MKKNKKIAAAGFELAVMVISIFAFSYFIHASAGGLGELNGIHTEKNKQFIKAGAELKNENRKTSTPQIGIAIRLAGLIFKKLKEPLIPVVSAEQSSSGFDAGCCALTTDGQQCATATPDNCKAGAQFAEGALCASTSFCQKGCCYDKNAGIYDKNVLKTDCPTSWTKDPNCNMPAAALGCCVLGTNSILETQGQCKVDTSTRALSPNSTMDWRGGLDEIGCLKLSATQAEGACVLAGKSCKFETETDCLTSGGEFNKDYLCTSSSLDTSCKITGQTACQKGKDGVYFLDSCGNYANIYDSNRKDDPTYWDKIIELGKSCGGTSGDGNANSKDCGNCNRFLGGLCGSAKENNFKVNAGDFYCKDTSCLYKGEKYKNGESWCIYDGAIGNGNDVVGSRHWKYVCAQGTTQVEPCADYRNQICVQTNTFDVNGANVAFKNAACVTNNWRKCIALNGEPGGVGKCAGTLNCRVERINIADHFRFDACTPKYPEGFSFRDARYQKTAGAICGLASQTCKVVYKPKTWGGCEIAANEGCLSEGFAQQMNNFCRKLGDCGGEVNVLGKYSGSYSVQNSPWLSQGYINNLKTFTKPVPGQFAKVEDYSKYLVAAGLLSKSDVSPQGTNKAEAIFNSNKIGLWTAGIGYAVGVWGLLSISSGSLTSAFSLSGLKDLQLLVKTGTSTTTYPIGAFAGAAIGAGIGMIAGGMLAKYLKLSPGGSLLMSLGGGLVGGAVAYAFLTQTTFFTPFFWIGVILILLSFFFGGSDCKDKTINVRFDCKPWQPPTGENDCSQCNNNPLKPCSEYRCESLGASCNIVNKGTKQEMCASSKDDGRPPILNPQPGVIPKGKTYGNVSDGGFSLTPFGGGCLDAYTPLTFGITTNKLAHCKFDIKATDFSKMAFDLGSNAYLYNHTTTFVLPDPSHGQSQGTNWTGDLTFYIKCVDTHGHETPNFYTAKMCVNEGPDKTPPLIRAVSPGNNEMVGFNVSEENISVITNELSTCRWGLSDADYSLMPNNLSCEDTLNSPSSTQGYLCKGIFSTPNKENIYYVRCEDQPWLANSTDSGKRNANQQSFIYKLLKPEKKITIDWIKPNQDFNTPTLMTTVKLKVRTSEGGEHHFCSYSFSGFDNMIEMFETGTGKTHLQPLNLPVGPKKIYVKCHDETGDSAQGETEFNITQKPIKIDWIAPNKSFESATEITPVELKVRTSGEGEQDTCSYSLSGFENMTKMLETGTGETHTQPLNLSTGQEKIYVKCHDEFGNSAQGETEFEIIPDTSLPQIARVWQTGSALHLITTEDISCVYTTESCSYNWDDAESAGSGKEHTLSSTAGKTYYIKCKDQLGNTPAGCSIVVQAT